MKVSRPSLKKISWLYNHPDFKKSPLRTIIRVIQWELIRLIGKPVLFIYDKSLSILLYPNDGVARLVFYFNYHEPSEFSFLDRYLDTEMICVDVGANIGVYSLFMAKRTNAVIAFEPQAEAMSRFETSVFANKLFNITRIKKAVSSRPGKLALSFVGNDSAKTFTTAGYENEANQNLVDAISLDIYFAENPVLRLDYLKIDAEGAEQEILLGAQKTLRELRPLVQIEISPEFQARSGKSDFNFNDFFINVGYKLCYIDAETATLRQGNAWNTIAVPDEKMISLQQNGLLVA